MTSCKHNCQCAARLERIETVLEDIASRILPKPEPSAKRLMRAIHAATGGTWFLAGELWRMAEAERLKAEVNGEEHPELSQALLLEGINSAHGLGRWIASHPSQQFERGAEERGGLSWRVCGFSGDETA